MGTQKEKTKRNKIKAITVSIHYTMYIFQLTKAKNKILCGLQVMNHPYPTLGNG